MATSRREIKMVPLTRGYTAQVAEIRSGDETLGTYLGGFWQGYELRLRDRNGRTLDTAKIESWGYPIAVSIDVAPDGAALALIVMGDDGFEQTDYALGIFEVDNSGKLLPLYSDRREGGRIVTERPQVVWTEDYSVEVTWVVEGASTTEPPEINVLKRPLSSYS